jgi:hypothetical protein
MAECLFCSEEIPADAVTCPLCLKQLPAVEGVEKDEAYELELPDEGAPEIIPAEWQGGAEYSLELPARCPHCREIIRTIRVLRLKRTQVTFTSTLPRGGRIIVCPQCERIISAELTAL